MLRLFTVHGQFGRVSNFLIIGCSYSTCSWDYSQGKTHDVRNFSQPGWWGFLDKTHRYEVHAFIAGGLYTYLGFLKSIEHRLPSFDAIILQETYEPRISKLTSEYADYYNYDNCDVYSYYCKRFPADEEDVKVNEYIHKCSIKIDDLLMSHGIPTFVFAWNPKFKKYKWCEYLDLEPLKKIFFFDERYHLFTTKWLGHINLDGNKKIGKMVDRELRKKLNGQI